MLTKRIGILFAAVAAGTLAGCGGGGGENVRAEQEAPPAPAPSAPAPPAPAPPASVPPDRVERPVQTTAYGPTTAAYTRPAGAAAIATDPEYRGLDDRGRNLNWALEAVKAADAYARLEAKYGAGTVPGAGQRIAVIDTGIDIVHGEIAPAYVAGRVSYTRLLGARREPYLNDDVEWEISHGTAVSSLILASKDASRQPWSFHGIAHGARLDMYGVMLGTVSGPYEPPPAATREAIHGYAQGNEYLVRQALSRRPDVVNMSFGAEAVAEQYLPQRAEMEQWLKPLIDRVKQSRETIFVAAAGNGHGRECARTTDAGCASGELQATSPSFDAALPLWDSSGEVGKRWVAVVATDRTNAIADFSNRCGLAAKWCMAAPGAGVEAAYTGEDPTGSILYAYRGWWSVDGTSFAAPLVSGGLAVVKQYFGDTLSMEQVLQRVYATADVTPDTVVGGGACPAHLNTDADPECELSSTHGRGLMNLERATRPVGSTSGGGTFADAGGTIAATLAQRGVAPVVFDSLGFPFRQPPQAQARALAADVDPIPAFAEEGDVAGAPHWQGLRWHRKQHAGGGPWAFASAGDGAGEVNTTGLAWRASTARGHWQAGFVSERDRVHGGTATGSWAGGGFWHHTTFLRAGRRWRLAGDAEEGVSIEAASTLAHGAMRGNGVLRETNGVYSSHAVHVDVDGAHRRTRLTLESPLRAEAGEFTLKVPVGGTLADGVRYADLDGALAPEAREVRLTGRHEVEGGYGRLAVAAGMRFNAGHLAGEEDWHAGVQWRVRF